MSLSAKGEGPTLRRAFVEGTLSTGGLSEDQQRITADRDSRIVGVQGGKNDNQGFMELSFSSQALAGGQANSEEDAQTLWVLSGNGDSTTFGDLDGSGQYVEWDEDEELHIHEVNNTGAGIEFMFVLYYVEEHEC